MIEFLFIKKIFNGMTYLYVKKKYFKKIKLQLAG